MMVGKLENYRVNDYNPDKEKGSLTIRRRQKACFKVRDILNQEHMHWMKKNCLVECKIEADRAKELKIIPESIIPMDTAKIIEGSREEVKNINLLFNKFPRLSLVNRDVKYGLEYQDVEYLNKIFKGQRQLIAALKARISSNIKLLKEQGYIFNSGKGDNKDGDAITMKSCWRIVAGLGGPSVYENSLILHHIYGIPYLPGSAVKGVTRSWVVQEYFSNKEDEAMKSDIFTLIFGTQQQQGKIIFLDAYINFTQEPFSLDVMTPHYRKYYTDTQLPTDNDWPQPITFLTIKDAAFDFYLGVLEKDNKSVTTEHFKCGKLIDKENENSTIHSLAVKFLREAMKNHGIGAKTSSGYGFFNMVKHN